GADVRLGGVAGGGALEQVVEFFFVVIRRARGSPLFPYTTLFRSGGGGDRAGRVGGVVGVGEDGRVAGVAGVVGAGDGFGWAVVLDRKSTRLNSSHLVISYAVFCLKKRVCPAAEGAAEGGEGGRGG